MSNHCYPAPRPLSLPRPGRPPDPTLGVVAVRKGDLERTLDHRHRALPGNRLSVPSLLMVFSELGSASQERYGSDTDAADYLDELRHLRDSAV